MRGRLRVFTVGFGLCLTLLGCSDPLGRAMGDKVEVGKGTTPTVVALPPRMTASTSTTTTVATTSSAPGTTRGAGTAPVAPSTAQLRDPAVAAPTTAGLPPTSVGTAAPRTSAPTSATTTAPRATTSPSGPLEVSLNENPFRCDGARRAFGTVSNASAGERVAFIASGIGELLPGTADGNGNVTIHWRCDANDAGSLWSITATGMASGRSASFDFKGAAPPTTAPPTSLTVSLNENPFRCDYVLRAFGTISGATPGETVTLSESSIGELKSGVADTNGQFPIKWRCPASTAGATWTITGQGTTSGRRVTFSFRGA